MASPDISSEKAFFFSANEEGTFGEKETLPAFE